MLQRYLLHIQLAKSSYKSFSQPGIGNQRNIEVNGIPPDDMIIPQLTLGKVLGYVYHKVNQTVPDVIQGVRVGFFIRPM